MSLPKRINLKGLKIIDLKYGENPQQKNAAFYESDPMNPISLARLERVSGEGKSGTINLTDVGSALCMFRDMILVSECFPFVVTGQQHGFAVKHGNACGAAFSSDAKTFEVIGKVILGDAQAAFGGVLLFDFHVGLEEAMEILYTGSKKGNKNYFNVIVAKSFSFEAVQALANKRCHLFVHKIFGDVDAIFDYHQNTKRQQIANVPGGFILQDSDPYVFNITHENMQVYGKPLTQKNVCDIALGWATMRNSNSNTITILKNGQLLGNGVGGQDRIGSAQQAIKNARKSKHDLHDAVVCSDSFFPFNDAPRSLIRSGIKVIYATSGSRNDEKFVALCKKHKVTLAMIPDTIGRAFSKHTC